MYQGAKTFLVRNLSEATESRLACTVPHHNPSVSWENAKEKLADYCFPNFSVHKKMHVSPANKRHVQEHFKRMEKEFRLFPAASKRVNSRFTAKL